MRRLRTATALASGALALGALAGCTVTPTATVEPVSQLPSPVASATPTPTASPTPTPTASATPTPAPTPSPTPTYRSPLDGLPASGPEPVLVVKLDNTRFAQPHAGLRRADVVYIEEVEYGITRLAAVFSSSVPHRIGPVRSARITDIDLLAQYDRPAFGFSGAQRKMWPFLDAAPFFDISPNKGAEGYSRDSHRYAPYNYYLDGQVGLKRAPKATMAKDMGFTFDEGVPAGGKVATSAEMAWGGSSAGFDYDRDTGEYQVSLNGSQAQAEENDSGQNAATVVIQYVDQEPSTFFDKGGGNTPHASTIGSGKAIVLRNGLAWSTTWSRPTAKDGTTFTLKDGSALPFNPGQLWVVMLDDERTADVKPLSKRRACLLAAATPAPSATAPIPSATTPTAPRFPIPCSSPEPTASATPGAQ